MTFARAARAAVRFWWIPIVIAVAGGLAATQVAGASKTTYSATGQIPRPGDGARLLTRLGRSDAHVPVHESHRPERRQLHRHAPAQTAATKLNDVTAAQLKSKLSFSAITGRTCTHAQRPALASGRRAAADGVPDRAGQLETGERRAPAATGGRESPQGRERWVQRDHPYDRNRAGHDPAEIYTSGSVDGSTQKGFPGWAAALGGIFAGFALGLLFAIVIGRFDDRIRRGGEVADPSMRPVDVDSVRRPASIHNLRCELELVGMAPDGATLAVTSLRRGERRTPVAAELARAFAAAGRPTVLVSADLRAGDAHDGGPSGVSTYLDGSDDTLHAVPLDENLVWVPSGRTSATPESLFSSERVSRLLDQARSHGSVVVIDSPRLEDDAEAPLIPGLADVTLLVLHSGQSRWSRVDTALGHLGLVARGPVRLCVDRGSGRGYTSLGSSHARRGRQASMQTEAQGTT